MKKQELSCLVKVRCSNTNKKGLAKASILIKIRDLSSECFLGFIVPKDHWDNELKQCKDSYPDFKSVNKRIEDALDAIKAHFFVLSKSQNDIDPEELKRAFTGKSEAGKESDELKEKAEPTGLLEIADEFIADFSEQVDYGLRSHETLKQWRATRSKIVEFARFQFHRQDIPLSAIKSDFGDKLYFYLTVKRQRFLKTEEGKRRNTNLKEAAARKQVKNIKQLIQVGVDKSLIKQNPIRRFKTSGGDLEVLPLELHEVNEIFTKKLPMERLEEVRDLFIFQCFTGFAYRDLSQLSKQHIVKVGLQRAPWLIKERGKTKVNEMVPLLPIALTILEKYRNHPYCISTNKLLPINSNSNYNGYLKEIAVLCGVDRPLKTHLARHTFADIMLNVCNLPLEDVSKMLGHKSLRTTMRYCRVRKERISKNMKVAHETLFDKNGKLNVA